MNIDPSVLLVGAGGVGGLLLNHARTMAGHAKEGSKRVLTASAILEGEPYLAVQSAVAGIIKNTAHSFGESGSAYYGPASLSDEGTPQAVTPRLSPGTRVCRIEGRRVVVGIEREKMQNQFVEKATLTCAVWHNEWLIRFVQRSVQDYRVASMSGLPVYAPDGAYWSKATTRPFRRMDTIVHSGGAPAKILAAVHEWQARAQEYAERGENHHIGFLLHGPPGTGKTSTAIAIASELRKPLYVLSLRQGKTDLSRLLRGVPSGAVLLVDECEQLFAGGKSGRDIDTATALSHFDGPLSQQGVVRVYTTNHAEKLDPAFRRAGRVDYEFEFTDKIVPLGVACVDMVLGDSPC